jgi:hypothetical protein
MSHAIKYSIAISSFMIAFRPLIFPSLFYVSNSETREATRFNVIASEKDLAFAEATAFRIKLRFWWRKLIKARIKMLVDASACAAC